MTRLRKMMLEELKMVGRLTREVGLLGRAW